MINEEIGAKIGAMILEMKREIVINSGGYGHNLMPNAKATERRKGFNHPQLDTGTMIGSLIVDVDIEGDEVRIKVTSPMEYSSYAQRKTSKRDGTETEVGWNFLDFTAEEERIIIQNIEKILDDNSIEQAYNE
jgi:hypothetical protein